MSIENVPGGSNSSAAGGNANDQQSSTQQNSDQPKPNRDSVSYDTHSKLLSEKKKIQERLEQFEAEARKREEEEARKRGDYESMLKAREQEALTAKQEAEKLRNEMNYARKMGAIVESLGGSVESKWFRVIDADQVAIDPVTGEVDKMTVNKLVEDLKKEWPEIVKSKPGGMPTHSPQGNGAGKIARSEWLKLPAKEMAKYRADMILD